MFFFQNEPNLVTSARYIRARPRSLAAVSKRTFGRGSTSGTSLSQKNCVARIAWLLLRIRAHLPADPKRPDARRNSSIFPTVKRLGSSICRGCKRFPVGGLRLMKSGSFQPNGGIGDRECPELMARTNDRASADGRRLAES